MSANKQNEHPGVSYKASSSDFGKTTDEVKVKMPGKVLDQKIERCLDVGYSKERQCSVFISDIPTYTVGMSIARIEPGSHDRKHRHTYETLLFVLEGKGYSLIEDEKVEWEAGDALYIPPWSWHQHYNTETDKPVRYLAATNAPLLKATGGIDYREEA